MGERYYQKGTYFALQTSFRGNKRCPNVACRNELGRLPLKELADLHVLKFWIHLENQPEDSIAKQCLKTSKEFADKNQVSLVQKVNNLCTTSNFNTANFAENNYSSDFSFSNSFIFKQENYRASIKLDKM